MTFKQMQDRVKFTLGAEEITTNDEVALIKDYLNAGIVNILTRTRPYTRQIQLNLTGGVAIHDMASSILALVDVEVPGQGFLRRYSREDITRMQDAGEAGFAYEEPLFWISPIATQNSIINAYGVFRPTPLVADADDPGGPSTGGLNPEFHEAIVLYALWKMAEYVQHEGSGQGERWRIQYEGQDGTEGEIARIKRILNKRVTPRAAGRRDLSTTLGGLSPSGSYIGANGA